jgi:O-acetyl-ADP-ribose deacetylase (regulator of RNase III)
MNYREEHRDLFSVDFKKYTPAHCISSDCKMGAGIAVPMKKKFKLGGMKNIHAGLLKSPTCVYHNGVYNLITKDKYYQKPTYYSITSTIRMMRAHAKENEITQIVMPKIGCGIDGLSWPKVREIVKQIFDKTDVEILVCHI